MPASRLNLDEFLPYRLSYSANIVSIIIARSYATMFGLKIPEWRLIAVIAEGDGITQQEIGRRTRMDKVTVSRATLALDSRHLITRRPNPVDGRSQLLRLSEAGWALYGEVAPKALALEAQIFGGFSPDEVATIKRLLRAIDGAAAAIADSE